jgi:hypothetical protein
MTMGLSTYLVVGVLGDQISFLRLRSLQLSGQLLGQLL